LFRLVSTFVQCIYPFCLVVLLGAPSVYAHQGPHTPSDLRSIQRMFEQGESEEARQRSREVIADPAANPEALLDLGRLLAERQIFPEALTAFSRVLELDPKSFPAAFNLGYVYFQQGDLQSARQILARSVELDPVSVRAKLLLGTTLLRLGDKQKALDQLAKADRLEPNNLDLLKYVALQFSEAGMQKDAITLIRRSLESNRTDPSTYILMIDTYRRAGDYSGAAEAAFEAVRRIPASARMSYLLGVQLQDVGRQQESRQYFERAVSLDPNFAEAYTALAELARRDGNSKDAVRYLRKALAIRPDFTPALIELGKNYMDIGRLEDARQAVTQAVTQAPDNPSPHLLLSQIYSAQKDFDKSAREKRIFQDLKEKGSSDGPIEQTMTPKLLN
jgi:tetratricopeptide (TPR) repeat protein